MKAPRDPSARLDTLTTAAGYERGAAETDKVATGLEVATVMLAHLNVYESSPLVIALKQAGFDEDPAELQQQALEAVKQKATTERSIADSMTVTADELRGPFPPPPPGPAPPDLAHPETRGRIAPGLGFLTS